MIIPKKVRQQWKLDFEWGDIEEIHKESNISRNSISNALSNGNCDKETFEACSKFYKNKKNQKAVEEKKLIKQALG